MSRPRLLALFAEPLVDDRGRAIPPLQLNRERDDLVAWLELLRRMSIDPRQFFSDMEVQ